MEPISNITPPVVNRFFTVAQVLAFNQSPMQKALKQVSIGGGSKANYLEGEYIRLVLNLLVGQGMWEVKNKLVSHEVRDIQKDVYNGREKTGTEDWLSISASVHTALVIHARDGTGATLTYEATTVGDGMNNPNKSISDALDKAIKSAETDGLKRCAINLGRVFGLDINEKVKREALPNNVRYYEDQIAEALARKAAMHVANDQGEAPAVNTLRTIEHAPRAAESAPRGIEAQSRKQPEPAADGEASMQQEAVPVRTKPVAVQNEGPASSSEPTAQAKPVPESKQEPRQSSQNPSQQEQRPKNDGPTQSVTSDEAAPAANNWELSLTPKDYPEWIKCIETMADRINKIQNEDEILNFIRRNKRLISRLPIIDATDGMPEKNFKTRWIFIVNKRCEELNIDTPAEYLEAA